ncbi:ubinuclein-2 isoform X2 [Raphanus sativus]|uniref:Ubinuclein-2 isoform X2 n=1 Tax=Raphanus sativus TaxID=3726 RepID=A0A6J0KHA6_RAPSA|nr:ubinuclein-2 isoform X2 [Raphanus sativus]
MGEHKATTTTDGGESSRTSPKLLAAADRKLLKVELRRGETTYVSWKKLMKEATKSYASSVPDTVPLANPNLESHLNAPGPPAEGEMVDQPHSNRFNAVIEKIERLYMGRDSSDGEELDGAPDDDEYDTEDSFIDDVELDEYFEVDDAKIKHDGFFVNKGKLEQIEPSTTTTTTSNQKPKKRQRKESAKPCGDVVDVSRKQGKIAKTDVGKDQSAASGPSLKKKSTDSKTVQDSVSLLKQQSGNDSFSLENVKHGDKGNQLRNALGPSPKSSKAAESSSGGLHLKYSNKVAHQQSNSPLPGKSRPDVLAKSTLVRQKENTDNAIVSRQSTQTTRKSGSNARPKTSTLEKAFRELEKVVAESRPPAATENQDADTSSSQAVKRRLPGDVKSKLAKVARIAASQGNVSGELINRLMSIVGHLIQVRSLKRNLKIMIDSGDSANREKDNKFQRIKNEVIEMLKAQVTLMEAQATNQEAGTSDDFQDAGPPAKKKFVMDAAMEEKLCDLYDIFVDGLDEDSGPHIRKLYANLAELWPNRLMDNHGIKRAICRAKERRRALFENHGKEMLFSYCKGQGKITKRKQTLPKPEGTTYPEKASSAGDKTTGVVVPSATTTSLVTTQPTVDKSKQQHEKLKGSSSSSAEAKAARRKTEKSVEESHQLSREKDIVLALKQQTQAPPDLNLPS